MMIFKKAVLLQLITLSLAACSGAGGDWPDLTAPLPDASERERVIVRGTVKSSPKAESGSAESATLSLEAANTLIVNTRGDIAAGKTSFETALQTMATNSDNDFQTHWNAAQIALTRLSQMSANLIPIEGANDPALASAKRDAKELLDALDAYVVDARKNLAAAQQN